MLAGLNCQTHVCCFFEKSHSFHENPRKMVDRYNLDAQNDYEPSDSEEEFSQRERQLLKKARKGAKPQESDDEEVLGFDDDGDFDEAFESEKSEVDEEDGLPDSRAWGKKKRPFYGTDFVDPDYQSGYNAQEEEVAEMELQEAKTIQQRLAKELDESDFSLDVLSRPTEETEEVEIPTDLRDISKREKLQLFKKDSPEFEGLVGEMMSNLEESRTVLAPFVAAMKGKGVELPIVTFAKTLNDLSLNYANNVAFYLLLKAQRIPVKTHPVVKRVFQIRQLIEKLQERYQAVVKPQIESFLEDLEADNVEKIDDLKEVTMLKVMKKIPRVTEEDETMEVDENQDEEEAGDVQDEMEKRKISYQMAKNKGLTPRRKSEQRNPRVRNRNRFSSATKKRNKEVRPVQKELKRYAGEATGIKSFVSRSTKIKH